MYPKILISLSLIILLIISCGLLPESVEKSESEIVVAQPTQTQPESIPSPTPISPPASPEAPQEPTPTPVITPEIKIALGVVNVDSLNLRIGPGQNHLVLRLLHQGQDLEIHGRSEKLDWLLVHLPSGTQGWVATQYVDTLADIAALPMREAYGGPYIIQPELPVDQREPLNLLVSIENNLAEITISGFPENSDIFATLGAADGSSELVVASGTTSLNGNATLHFNMPTEFADGNPVKSGELTLVVATMDGSFSLPATIQYFR
ncbi:SH3 domain-containing protein [Chloroflexota bacterium]